MHQHNHAITDKRGRCCRSQCFSRVIGLLEQALAILLKQLHAKPMGLYDGVRLFCLNQPGGGTLTLTVSCEREQWRVQNSDSAKGIGRTWVCTGPARVLE